MDRDDDLTRFEAEGAPELRLPDDQGQVAHDGALLWYASFGSGPPVVLLHGGLGHSGNWGYQLEPLMRAGHRAILIDSRGHGRSTRDARPFSYSLMAPDVRAVMDHLRLDNASIVGWSDGACIGLVLAMTEPARVARVFFFGCNMDPSGAKKKPDPTPMLQRCFRRHAIDYACLSATPAEFDAFVEAVGFMMKSEPNVSADDLSAMRVPVAIVQSEHDEFIKREHADYLARTIPGAELILLPGVSHFAPLQRPELFNDSMLSFLRRNGDS